jgi:signal transduction histidine kinase/ActR/RegA family two-component response regulator
VLLVGVCATLLITLLFLRNAETRDRDRLRLEADLAVSALQERMEAHSALLRGAAGLFAGSDEVDAREFDAYVGQLGLGTRYPGVLGIGFAARAEGEAGRDTLVASMRRQGFSDFRVWPEEPRPIYTSITYLYPMNARNAAAVGYDMFTEPRRREAMTRAAATGQLAATSRVELVQEIDDQKQPGFIMYLAVRDRRTRAIEGFVYSPLRAGDLLQTVFPMGARRLTDVAVYDGQSGLENLLFTTGASDRPSSEVATSRRVEIGGRPWLLAFTPRPAFAEGSNRALAWWAGGAGALTTLALTLAVVAQARGAMEAERARAALRDANLGLEDRVEARTRELRDEMGRREAAEEQVRQMQKMEAIGQLSGGIAHDFNNMLAIVIGSLDMARRRMAGSEDPRVLRYMDNAAEGARRAAVLTGRLLAFARRQQLSPEPLDPNRLVSGMIELLRRALGERVEIEVDLADGVWAVHADAAELENALLNLAVNARDAMPEGGRLTLATANASTEVTRSLPPGDYVSIRVTDTGVGMPPEVLARAFEPFFTTKEVGKGTGLGLSQVYGFVRQSGGEVVFESEPGVGTSVTILLPRWKGEVLARDPRLSSQQPPARALDGETVLVVEDEADVRRLSVETLRELGYLVHEAADGREALKVLAQLPRVDLLFTDIVMPGLNGFQLARQARGMRPGLKVLLTTGYAHGAAVGIEAGSALPTLAKPFTLDQLARRAREALDGGVTDRAV